LIYLAVIPAVFGCILYRNRATLHTEETKQSLGSLYMNYETNKSSVFHFTATFLYRRLLFALLIGIGNCVVVQIYITSYSSILLLSYVLHYQPMESDVFDFLAIFNEGVLLFGCTLLFLYTEYVSDPEVRYSFGNIFVYTVIFNFGVNLLLLFNEIRGTAWLHCKRWNKHRRIRKN
jgi:hypothetical protein